MTSNQDSAYFKALVDLGLTGPQARTYITLLEVGISTVNQLAVISKADRPDTYRATADLLKLGLIEKVVSKPTKYKPLAFTDAVHILIRRKLKENAELFANIEELIRNFKEKPKDETPKDDNQFVLIPNGEATELKLIRLFENAKESVSIIAQTRRIFTWPTIHYEEALKALKRHVTIKIIAEKSDRPDIPTKIQELMKSDNVQIRYLNKSPNIRFKIYDSKELLLTTSAASERMESSSVWSNNTYFLELAQAYFDSVWETAEK